MIKQSEITDAIKNTASSIDQKYQEQELTIILIMKGALCVASDLLKELNTDAKIDYICCSSYGENGMTPGNLYIDRLEKLDIEGKNVLIVDDIFDTGHTMYSVVQKLKEKNPKSIESLVLLSKGKEHPTGYKPEYILFEIEDKFVIGYGLDYKEKYRGLKDIYAYDN